MTVICGTCQKVCASEFGLRSHAKTHSKEPETANDGTPPVIEKSVERADFVETARNGNFALAVCGDLAVLTDLEGKRLSRPMHIDKATSVFSRMATARR